MRKSTYPIYQWPRRSIIPCLFLILENLSVNCDRSHTLLKERLYVSWTYVSLEYFEHFLEHRSSQPVITASKFYFSNKHTKIT